MSPPLPRLAPNAAKSPPGRGLRIPGTPPSPSQPLLLPSSRSRGPSCRTISLQAAFVSLQPQKKNDGFELLTPPQKRLELKGVYD